MDWQTWNLVAMGVGYVTMSAIVWLAVYFMLWLVQEAVRSYRQTRRCERIALGKGNRMPLRPFLKRWRREFCRDYHSITLGGFRLPHDVNQPIRRDW